MLRALWQLIFLEFYGPSAQSAGDNNSDTSSTDDNDVNRTPAKHLRSRTHTHEHSVTAAAIYDDELYCDLESGKDEWRVSPARESWPTIT